MTDASGALTISDLPAGEPIRVQVVAPAHAKAHFMLSAARTRHTIHVPSGLLLQGVVVDEAGAPQSGLAVGARGATDRPSGRDGVVLATETSHVTTAPDGSFAFEGMAPGDYVLGLDDETVTAPVVVTVVPDRVAEAVRLVKSSRPSRLFHLMDDEDTPVPVGTRVTVDFPERNPPGISGPFAASRSVRLGEQGSFRASARVGERLEVTLRSMNSVVTAEGRVAEGPVTVLRLRPRRSATEEEVVLLVVAPDGSPIAGARATVRTPGNAAIPRTFLADADGSLPLVVTANSEVYVSGPANGRERFQSVRFSSDTLRGDTDGRRVVLRSQGGFRIVAPDGASLAYALVTLRSSDGTTRLAVTDEFGEFVPLGAVEGEVTMVAIGLVRAYAMEPIYEVRDFSLESIVRLPPQGTLTLHASSVGNQGNVELEFVDAAGTPVTGASVYLDAGAGVGAVLLGSRERDGVVVLEGLPCRPFRFSVRVPGMTCDPSSTEIVPGGPRVVVVCRGR